MSEEKVTRRNYLKYAGIAAAGLIVGGAAVYMTARQPSKPTPTPTSTPTVTVTTPVPTKTPEPKGKLKIGLLYPLSGTYSMWGKDQVENATLAIEEWQAKGGPGGYEIGEIIVRDTETKPGPGVRRMNELIDDHKVDLLFAVLSSGVAFAANEVAKEKGMWWVYGAGAEPKMRMKDVRAPFSWQPFHGLECQVRGAAEFYINENKPKTYIAYADYVAGQLLQEMYTEWYEARGGEIVASKPFPLGSTDYSSYITEALKLEPDVYLFVGGGSDLVNNVKQAAEFKLMEKMNFHVGHGGTVSLGQGVGASVTQHLTMGAYFSWVDDIPSTKAYVQKFQDRFGYPPDYFGASVYTGVHETFYALDKVGKLDYEEMAAVLEGRRYTHVKEEEYWRKEDHQAIGQYMFLKGKAPEEMETPWDFFKVIGKVDEEKAGIVEPINKLGY